MVLRKRPGVRTYKLQKVKGEFPAHFVQDLVRSGLGPTRLQQKLYREAVPTLRGHQGNRPPPFAVGEADVVSPAIHHPLNPRNSRYSRTQMHWLLMSWRFQAIDEDKSRGLRVRSLAAH